MRSRTERVIFVASTVRSLRLAIDEAFDEDEKVGLISVVLEAVMPNDQEVLNRWMAIIAARDRDPELPLNG